MTACVQALQDNSDATQHIIVTEDSSWINLSVYQQQQFFSLAFSGFNAVQGVKAMTSGYH